MNRQATGILPVTSTYLPATFAWQSPPLSPAMLDALAREVPSAPFLADLARVEWAAGTMRQERAFVPESVVDGGINPSLDLLEVQWSRLPELLIGQAATPRPEKCYVAIYRSVSSQEVRIETLSGYELLALKIVAEGLDRREVAATGRLSVQAVDAILSAARTKGLLIPPRPRLVHPFSSARPEVFTLQWHLTQKCDLHCRHCYDRNESREMNLQAALEVLDQLYTFCDSAKVAGQVTFTGGNPFLYTHFEAVYAAALERGFMTAILGNPVPRRRLESILAIHRPEFFQVSLEGLRRHNDYIRGPGHFARTMAFLDLLGELGIFRMVMLTLTRDNVDDVIPLAKRLEGRVEKFTFNRLAAVGEGAALATVPPVAYQDFLLRYREQARRHAHIGCKDNLFNILQDADRLDLTGGCTGYGCGAAFNFVSLLPDGEVHACRKFPSPLGNVRQSSLEELYAGDLARQYRQGSTACSHCRLRGACGGCQAVVHGCGGEPLTDRDPYCFI